MKYFLTILLLCVVSNIYSQLYTVDDINGWMALTHAPSDTSTKKHVIVFITGSGEVGTDTANGAKYGPLYQFRNGWDGKAYGEEFWIVHLVPSSATTVQSQYRTRLNMLFAKHPSWDTCRVYLTGLSMGGAMVTNQMSNIGGSDWMYFYRYAAIVAMSVGDYSSNGRNMPVVDGIGWLNSGGRWYGLVGNSDPRWQTENYADSFAIVAPGTSQFYEYVGGHDGWENEYKYTTKRLNNENVYEYMAKHSKRPYANAGETVITTTDATVTLNGIVDSIPTGFNGSNRTITWSQQSGPTATINSVNSDTTTVDLDGGVGTYVFRITSANAAGGLSAHKDVTVTREAAPAGDWWFIKKSKLGKVKFF